MCFIFISRVIISLTLVQFSLVFVMIKADILDDVGLYDPLNIFWNRNTIFSTINRPCTGTANLGTGTGTCDLYTSCAINGGQSYGQGNCSIFQTCCVFQRSCGSSSRAKISTFTNPASTAALPDVCTYRVILMNPNVCQVRIDIISTNLAEPGSHPPPADITMDQKAGKCDNDYISIENSEVKQQINVICGRNSNQHIYARVSPSDRFLDIRVVTSNRATALPGANLPSPTWNLQMTQLECPGTAAFISQGNKSPAAADFSRLAPDGCLQYFTDVSGEIKTFNYGGNTYMNGMNYASCFRRPPSSCGLSLSLGEFALQAPVGATGAPQCVDYLYIPERRPQSATNPLSMNPSVCGPADADWPSISSHPGPLYVHFRSDGTMVDKGYRLLYSTANNC